MPSTLYALYLSRAAHDNLPIGLAAGRWGLTEDAVERYLGQLPTPQTGLEVLEQMQVGDHVLAASGGPQPRVKRGEWAGATIEEASLWRVTTPYYYDTSPIWTATANRPGETYPHRFGIEEVEQLRDIDRALIGLTGLDALHYSANIGGLPVPVLEAPPVMSNLGDPGPGETEDPAFLVLDGEFDSTTLTIVRREQRKLRQRLLGNSSSAECSLCGRTVPTDCLRTAHIKKRSECSEAERLDLANIMPACTLGCDHLFELGYVYVDEHAVVRRNTKASTTSALDMIATALEGRLCSVHSAMSEPYFAWHRARLA